jgi:hypothetical protein
MVGLLVFVSFEKTTFIFLEATLHARVIIFCKVSAERKKKYLRKNREKYLRKKGKKYLRKKEKKYLRKKEKKKFA